MIYKALHIKVKTEQHEPHYKNNTNISLLSFDVFVVVINLSK